MVALPIAWGQCTTQKLGLLSLLVGYGLAGLLLLVYFCWEGGWWHSSRRVEAWYIAAVLFLVPVSGFLSAMVRFSECSYETDQKDLAELLFRQAIQLGLIFQIVQSLAWPRMLPRFYDTRPPAERKRAPVTRRAAAVARELEAVLSDILEENPALFRDEALGPVMFMLLMFEQVIWASDILQTSPYIPVGLACLVVLGILFWLWRSRKTMPLVDQICDEVSDLLRNRDKETLQFVLEEISVATLLEVGRHKMVDLLTNQALDLNMLSLLSKAILVDALQASGLRFSRTNQKAVWRIIFSCKGVDLTALKNLVDGGGNYHNLYKLVYTDMTKGDLRTQVLRHFATQAAAARSETGGSFGVKVLSDIDDTLYCSGGRFPAGCDTRYPQHMVYPGCLALFRVFDRVSRGSVIESLASMSAAGALPAGNGGQACNLVFLSARPHIYKDLAEDRSYRLFRGLVTEGRMHVLPTLLPGSLTYGLAALFSFPCRGRGAWRRVGEAKYATFLQFRELYMEYDFIFCGDNGQGDLLAGQLMFQQETRNWCSSDDFSLIGANPLHQQEGRVLAVLIHEVVDPARALAREAPSQRTPAWRSAMERSGFVFHHSYVGAALALHLTKPQLVSASDLREVASEALAEFEADVLVYKAWKCRWAAAALDLVSDLKAANETIQAAGLPPLRDSELLRLCASGHRRPTLAQLRRASHSQPQLDAARDLGSRQLAAEELSTLASGGERKQRGDKLAAVEDAGDVPGRILSESFYSAHD